MLRAYYDCSGQPHDFEFVTLAGVIASESVGKKNGVILLF
jgi:hypothetical protein